MKSYLFLLISFFLFSLFSFLNYQNKALALDDIPKDIFIAAIVEPWIYFDISPLTFNLQPDLVAPDGTLHIGESPEILIRVGTSNPYGWEIKIKGKNNGLKSEAANYLIPSVIGSAPLIVGIEGYGLNATATFQGVIINPIYSYYNTNIVGEIIDQYRLLASKFNSHLLEEVVRMKIKATASMMTPAEENYLDIINITINPRL